MKLSFLSAIFCAFFCVVLVCFVFLGCLGCASIKKSVGLGFGAGAVTGAASLALISHESQRQNQTKQARQRRTINLSSRHF